MRVRGGDNPTVKIESLEAEKITKMKWLALGCIEAFFFAILLSQARRADLAAFCTNVRSGNLTHQKRGEIQLDV